MHLSSILRYLLTWSFLFQSFLKSILYLILIPPIINISIFHEASLWISSKFKCLFRCLIEWAFRTLLRVWTSVYLSISICFWVAFGNQMGKTIRQKPRLNTNIPKVVILFEKNKLHFARCSIQNIRFWVHLFEHFQGIDWINDSRGLFSMDISYTKHVESKKNNHSIFFNLQISCKFKSIWIWSAHIDRNIDT